MLETSLLILTNIDQDIPFVAAGSQIVYYADSYNKTAINFLSVRQEILYLVFEIQAKF